MIKVDLGTLPSSDKQASNNDDGKHAAPAKADTLADLGMTDIDPDCAAADRGIQPADVITSINSNEVNNTDDVKKAMADAMKSGRKAVLMQISRDNSNRFVALPVVNG